MNTKQEEVKSYRDESTSKVKGYLTYEKDFTNQGKFYEEEEDLKIDLELTVFPGVYDGKKWNSTNGATVNDSYAIHLTYHNKNHLDVVFSAAYGTGEHLKDSFEFVKQAAEKFHLVSEMVVEKIKESPFEWYDKPERPNWEDVTELYDTKPSDSRDGKSWQKIMTIQEAKELFDYLKIEVEFPS